MDSDPRLGPVSLDLRGSETLRTLSLIGAVVALIGLPAGWFIPESEGAVKWIVFGIGAAAAIAAIALRLVNRFIRVRVGAEGILRENELFRREELVLWQDVVEIRAATWELTYKYGMKVKKGALKLKTAAAEMTLATEVPRIQEVVAAAEEAVAERLADEAREELGAKGEAHFGPLAFNGRELLVPDKGLSFRLEDVNNLLDDGRRISLLVKGRALAAWSGHAYTIPNRTALFALVADAMRELPKADEVEGAMAGAEHKVAVAGAHVGIIAALALLILGGAVAVLCDDVLTLGNLRLSFFGYAALAGAVVCGVAGLASFRKATETGSVDTTLGGLLKKWFWVALLAGGVPAGVLHGIPREVVLDSPVETRFLVSGRPYDARREQPARLRTLGLSKLEIAATRGSETIETVTLELKDSDKWLYNPKGEGSYQAVRVPYINESSKTARKGKIVVLQSIQGRAVIKAGEFDFVLKIPPETVRSRSDTEKLAIRWAP